MTTKNEQQSTSGRQALKVLWQGHESRLLARSSLCSVAMK